MWYLAYSPDISLSDFHICSCYFYFLKRHRDIEQAANNYLKGNRKLLKIKIVIWNNMSTCISEASNTIKTIRKIMTKLFHNLKIK